jgi:hypothetical protein
MFEVRSVIGMPASRGIWPRKEPRRLATGGCTNLMACRLVTFESAGRGSLLANDLQVIGPDHPHRRSWMARLIHA